MPASRLRRLLVGGSSGNEHLTLAVAALLLVLLAVEGATLLDLNSLPPGLALRVALVGASLVAGAALATATLPAADRLQDHASAHMGFDEH